MCIYMLNKDFDKNTDIILKCNKILKDLKKHIHLIRC